MMLLTQDLIRTLPALRSTDGQGDAAIARCKFFTPWSNWTWYVTEGAAVLDDGREIALREVDARAAAKVKDILFYGLVDGFEREYGYFALSELRAVTGPEDLQIERDLYWTPRPLSEC